jgi:hypothetical protein
MNERPPECPRCGRPMEPGYILDQGYGTVSPSAWVAGRPERSRWTGLKLRGKDRLPVTTFRCPKCARLESFAWPE